MYSLNCKGKLLSLETPVVMGILNITPDSFYKGFLGDSLPETTDRAGKMIAEGAAILDIGGQSTRPGSAVVEETEELDRVLPVIESLSKNFPGIFISIDTYYAEVAKQAFAAGARIVNDISGGSLDEKMIATVGALEAPYICMHMRGNPSTMSSLTDYDNILAELFAYFRDKIELCQAAGIKDIVLDPGFGFAKTIAQNFYLLRNLEAFTILGFPILAGISRKATIYKTLGTTAEHALNGTTALNMIALQKGASILRVHDVKEAVETINLFLAVQYSQAGTET